MKMRKRFLQACMKTGILCFFLWAAAGPVFAQSDMESQLEEAREWTSQFMGELNFEEVQQSIEAVLEEEFDFQDMVVEATEGGSLFSPIYWADRLLHWVESEWNRQKETFISILTLTVCAAFLANFSRIFKNQQIAEVSFEITYMLLFLILLRSFTWAAQIGAQVLQGMQDFMQALIPAYFLSVTMASSPVTAGVFYPFVLGMVYVIRWLLEYLLLPILNGYVILVFVNHLTKEEYLSQFAESLFKGMGWILKSMLALVAGFHIIQGIVSPAVDSFRNTAFSRVAKALPGVGNLAGSVTDMLLGSGILIKNSIGAAALAVLFLICLIPLIQIGVWVFMLEMIAAVTQPVSDKRMTGCITGISNAGKLLFRMVFTVAVLFMLSIALVTVATGLKV